MKTLNEMMMKNYIGAEIKMREFLEDEKGDIHSSNILIFILIAIMAGGLIFAFVKGQTPGVLQKLLDKFTTIFSL